MDYKWLTLALFLLLLPVRGAVAEELVKVTCTENDTTFTCDCNNINQVSHYRETPKGGESLVMSLNRFQIQFQFRSIFFLFYRKL